MSQKHPKNIAASIRQKLLNKARNDHKPFTELLQYFAMERFLYRLSKSKYRERLILKGALALLTWDAPLGRPTKDIDLLGMLDNDVKVIEKVVTDICNIETDIEDGLSFEVASIKGVNIKEDADYQGVRIRFVSYLESARITLQIDIGFGDVVYPKPKKSVYPTLLDLPAPNLLSYSKETAIAEKLEAMIKLAELNSRMKDFYDIWLLSRQFEFGGRDIQKALEGTFTQRGTKVQFEITAFSDEFVKDKDVQWKAFRKKLNIETIPEQFDEVVTAIKLFLEPVLAASVQNNKYHKLWHPVSGWA